jgi:hypothetical protein
VQLRTSIKALLGSGIVVLYRDISDRVIVLHHSTALCAKKNAISQLRGLKPFQTESDSFIILTTATLPLLADAHAKSLRSYAPEHEGS